MITENTSAAVPLEHDVGNKHRIKNLIEHCRAYKGADTKRSIIQLATNVVLFFTALAVLFFAINQKIYWLYALLLLPTSAILIRLFIIQHDCGHGSFFSSRLANDMTGRFISVLSFIPYSLWKRAHNMHHASSGNLSRRGSGDVDTLTVKEYNALSPRNRFLYRVYRNPLLLLLFGPPFYVLIMQRFPPMQSVPFLKYHHTVPVSESWSSVMLLNLSLLAIYGALTLVLGWKAFVLVYLPVLTVSFLIGQWGFFVQHQFEDTYWEYEDKWNLSEAAFRGSSYYTLPRVLQWFTGNIGFHHIHHMCSMIPNYRLQECCDANKELSNTSRLTILQSLKCIRLALWDEERSRMIGFRELVPC